MTRTSSQRAISALLVTVWIIAPAVAAEGDVTTRVFVGDCIAGPNAGGPRVTGLLDAVVGTAIRGGLGRLGTALRAAGAARSRTAVAQLNLELEPGESPRCVQLVHGAFDRCETVRTPWLPPVLLDGDTTVVEAARRASLAGGICPAGEPAVFVELALRRSADGSALALAPTVLHYGTTLDGRSGSRERALALQLAFHPPGESANDLSATGGLVVFGTTAVGSSVHFTPQRPRDVRPLESAWFPTPFPPSAAPGRGNSPASVPSTLTATLVETRDERPFLMFLADLLEGSSDQLESELQSLVIRDRRRQLELEAERARQLAQVEFQSKRTAAILARMTYCALPDDDTPASARARLEASTELMRAEVEANLAADSAGRPRQFDPPISPSSGPRVGC